MNEPRRGWPLLAALVGAMLLPTAVAWFYFVVLAGGGTANPVQQAVYGFGKVVQFALPVVALRLTDGAWPRPSRPRFAGVLLGLGFGFAVVLAMLGLYHFVLAGTPLLAGAPAKIREKLVELGMATPARYVALAVFLSVVHSLLEEYYWRWFVFGRLRAFVGVGAAAGLSSLAFMAHHVIVLATYLPGQFFTAAVPLSLAVAAGGAAWAWLYQRTGSIYAGWLSHALIDIGIFAVGWDLVGPL